MAREMKDSGIEWIGEIPREWKTVKFKYTHIGSNVGEAIDKIFWSTDENDRLFYTAQIQPIRTSYKDFPKEKYTTQNDILLARNATPYVYLPFSGAVYTDHIIRTTIRKEFDKKFVRYCLQNSIKSIIVEGVSIPTWSISIWNNQTIPCPVQSKQQAIADFLDTQCAHIDSVIEKTRAAIEEYKKLKQAVITQAVTKGIRPNREMKDSGIEWVGEIPKEWNVQRIKTIFSLRDERNYLPLEEVNLISLYTDKGVVQHSDLEKTTGNKASNADGYKIVYENDIIVNIILCWMGAIGRSAYQGVTSPAYDIYVPSNTIECRFYHHYFRTKGFSGDCYKRGKGIMAMRWRTYSDQFRDIKVVVPPLEEQQEILNYLDEKTATIDSLIQKKEQLISELEAYKKSLIYEYVTGKKEIPDEKTISVSSEFQIALLICIILKNTEIKGRIHLQKVIYALDTLLGLFSETQYYRYPHGPYDLQIEKYESIIAKQGWVVVDKSKGYVRYTKTDKFMEFESLYQDVFKERDKDIRKICNLFNVKRTSKAEKMATLLASWNDFLIDGIAPTDDMIINDIVTNWTDNKANIAEETWREELRQLKEKQLVPKGYGKHTLKKEQNAYAH